MLLLGNILFNFALPKLCVSLFKVCVKYGTPCHYFRCRYHPDLSVLQTVCECLILQYIQLKVPDHVGWNKIKTQ